MAQDVQRILAKIRSGALPPPRKPPAKCYAGKGSGRLCDACNRPITSDDVEYELDATLIFHRNCYVIWLDAAGA
jgi:hypothetical protein